MLEVRSQRLCRSVALWLSGPAAPFVVRALARALGSVVPPSGGPRRRAALHSRPSSPCPPPAPHLDPGGPPAPVHAPHRRQYDAECGKVTPFAKVVFDSATRRGMGLLSSSGSVACLTEVFSESGPTHAFARRPEGEPGHHIRGGRCVGMF